MIMRRVQKVGVGLGLRQWIPSHDAGPSICLLRQVAHVACPTCGLTRSLASLARGEWGAAMTLHPFGVLLVAQLAAGWLLWGVAVARGRPVLSGRTAFRILLANGGTLLALWLVRLVTGTLPA